MRVAALFPRSIRKVGWRHGCFWDLVGLKKREAAKHRYINLDEIGKD